MRPASVGLGKADGEAFALDTTFTVADAVRECPTESFTVTREAYVPAAEKVWDTDGPDPDPPSPKDHA